MDSIEQPVHSVLADAATGCRAGHDDDGVVPRSAAVAAGVFGVTPGYDPAEINTTELPDVVGTASIPSAVLEPEVKDNAYVTPPSLGPDAGSAGAGNGYVVPVSDSHSHTVDATAMDANIAPVAAVVEEKKSAEPSAALIALFGAEDMYRDWNEDFQSLYDLAVFTPYQIAQANAKKRTLFAHFLKFTRKVAQQLVAQLHLPRSQWRIPPQDGAGYAGGQKFKVGNIFCKFARDDKGLYRGNDELAIKMAKNEIRCGNAVLKLHVSSLHLSLMACHRVRGHAVITTALIPISGDSLVYGSQDAARTVHIKSPQMNLLVDRVAAQLNLKPHAIRNHPATKLMATGVDCEGHISAKDGRLYLLDLGRLLPANNARFPFNLLHQFRPEYMQARADQHLPSLSADAFSSFGLPDDNPAVEDAIRHFFTVHIPAFIKDHLLKPDTAVALASDQSSAAQASVSSGVNATTGAHPSSAVSRLAQLFHQHGINMRYLGYALSLITPDAALTASMDPEQVDKLRLVLLKAMLLRAIKCIVQDGLRKLPFQSLQEPVPASLFSALTTEVVLSKLYAKFPVVSLENLTVSTSTLASVLTSSEVEVARSLVSLVASSAEAIALTPQAPGAKANAGSTETATVAPATAPAPALDPFAAQLQALCLRPQVDLVEAPDFPTVEQAEAVLLAELRVREATVSSTSPVLLPTLELLLQLYQSWHELDPKHTLAKATGLIDRITAIAELDTKLYHTSLRTCAQFLMHVGQLDKASSMIEYIAQVLEKCEEPMEHIPLLMQMMGELRLAQLLYDDAVRMFRMAAQYREQFYGSKSLLLAESLSGLATVFLAQGRYSKAKPRLEHALEIQEQAKGTVDPSLSVTLQKLAEICTAEGRNAEAIPLLERSLAIRKQALGSKHPTVAMSLNCLALAFGVEKQFSKAEELVREALDIQKEVLGEKHPDIGASLCTLARLSKQQLRWAETETLYKLAVQLYDELTVENGTTKPNAHLANTLHQLSLAMLEQGRDEEAKPFIVRSLKMEDDLFGDRHPNVADFLRDRALIYETRANQADGDVQLAHSEKLLVRAHAIVQWRLMEYNPKTQQMLKELERVRQQMELRGLPPSTMEGSLSCGGVALDDVAYLRPVTTRAPECTKAHEVPAGDHALSSLDAHLASAALDSEPVVINQPIIMTGSPISRSAALIDPLRYHACGSADTPLALGSSDESASAECRLPVADIKCKADVSSQHQDADSTTPAIKSQAVTDAKALYPVKAPSGVAIRTTGTSSHHSSCCLLQ